MHSIAESAIAAFISYSHKDEALLDQLKPHLATLKRQGLIQTWDDRQIVGGSEWAEAIARNLETADIILLLVSADFIASDYCWGIELQRAIARHESSSARVIPIILRPVDWEDTPFRRLQALPKGGKPVTEWENLDTALVDIARGIRKVVEELRTQREQVGQRTPIGPAQTAQTASLHVHGWICEDHGDSPTVELDWTTYFYQNFPRPEEPRRVASPEVWASTLYPQLEQAREALTQNQSGTLIDLRGQLPLTAALAIGKVFPIAGHTLQVNQRTGGKTELWRSDATGGTAKFQEAEKAGEAGPNLLIALNVGKRPVWRDVERLYKSPNYDFDAVAVLKAEKEILDSAADATALADSALDWLRNNYLDAYRAERIHLVLACPQSFAVFLGQRLRFLGKVITYEHQPTDESRYVPSVVLHT